ncbi:MAG TPA: flagellar hook-associated protein FlgK [Steroidobacteraceae bacterium]|nr:flagellar hook-associated protein FlgK [Steroidobacteraceae bacterium]
MSDVFGISVSALQAFQNAINVTSNNVANASTPGYDRESVILTEAIPQSNGSATVGAGVVVAGISRAYSQAAANQLNTSQSSLGQLTALQNYSTQIDNLFGTTAGGLSTALQSFYSAFSDVANNPTSTASRQALLGQAQSVAGSFQNASGELSTLNTDVNSRITADVTQINSIASAISTLNKQIVVGTAQNGNQPPNELLDQRDQLLSKLSQLVGVSTTTEADGALNVFVGNGQALVLQGQTTALTTVANQFNAAQLEIASSASNVVISSSITSGDLGGLLAARAQVINPALNQLGQIATAVSQTVNSQQADGLDLSGNFGANIFSVGTPLATGSAKNTDAVTASVSVNANGLGALTANDYVLSFVGGTPALTNTGTGASVTPAGAGTIASPYTADGISIVLSGAPAAGDQFLVQPTATAAASFKVVLTNPSQIAAAGAIKTGAAGTNTGAATISSGTVLNPANPNLQQPATITFANPPTSYSVNGGAPVAYTNGGNITANGWQVQISGAPASGDTFTVTSNAGGTGDNRNALAAANALNVGVLDKGTVSVTGGLSALITGLGSQAQQINTAQTAQAAVNSQALSSVQSVSGVNLDEEAASLLQWQQAYQAAAHALTIGNSLFTTLIDSVNGTFT